MNGETKVEILGQTYTIKGDLDESYVQQLAQYVDERMRLILNSTSTVDTQRVAVLAALSIADDFFNQQRELSEDQDLLRERAEHCLALVEQTLKQTA